MKHRWRGPPCAEVHVGCGAVLQPLVLFRLPVCRTLPSTTSKHMAMPSPCADVAQSPGQRPRTQWQLRRTSRCPRRRQPRAPGRAGCPAMRRRTAKTLKSTPVYALVGPLPSSCTPFCAAATGVGTQRPCGNHPKSDRGAEAQWGDSQWRDANKSVVFATPCFWKGKLQDILTGGLKLSLSDDRICSCPPSRAWEKSRRSETSACLSRHASGRTQTKAKMKPAPWHT